MFIVEWNAEEEIDISLSLRKHISRNISKYFVQGDLYFLQLLRLDMIDFSCIYNFAD
jgi:hypothetical protein